VNVLEPITVPVKELPAIVGLDNVITVYDLLSALSIISVARALKDRT
jgi:hypothetical protein